MYKWIIIVSISFIATALSILSGYYGWENQIWIVGIIYFLTSVISIHKLNYWTYSIIVLFPFLLFFNYLILKDSLYHVLPIGIIPLIAYITGSLIKRRRVNKGKQYIILIGLYLLFLFICRIYLMPNYLDYYFNWSNINMEINSKVLPDINVYNKFGEKIDLDDYDNKILVIDIWSTNCSWCFKYFPYVHEIKNEYSKYDNIEFKSLNSMQRRDSLASIIRISDSLQSGYSQWYTIYPESIDEMNKLGINKYPYFIVTNSKHEIVYFGSANPSKTNLNRSIRKSLNSLVK